MRRTYFVTGSGGFYSKSYTEQAPLNALIEGSFGFWYNPEGTLETHPGTVQASPFLVGDIAFPYGDGFGVIGLGINDGAGNAVKYIGNAAIFTTNREINIFDPVLTNSTITFPFVNIERFVPYVAPYKGNGVYRTPTKLGILAQEKAPFLEETSEAGQLDGFYAARLTYVRTFTGGESLSSPSSNTVEVNPAKKKIKVTFPLPTNPVYIDNSSLSWDTNDKWFFYVTPRNFGNTTVFFKLKEIPERLLNDESYSGGWTSSPAGGGNTLVHLVSDVLSDLFDAQTLSDLMTGKNVHLDSGDDTTVISVTTTSDFTVAGTLSASTGTTLSLFSSADGGTTHRQLLMDWSENDLDDTIPPILNFPPATTAKFIIPLVNTLVLVGTDGGNGVAPSVQNFFEAFPPSFRLALPETPVGVSYKPEDAYSYILCKQSTHELRWTGATDGAPVALRKVSTKGTANAKSFVVVDGSIFSFTPDRNIILINPGGSTNLEFAFPVRNIIKNWNPELVVASFDEKHNAVIFFHRREFLSYHIDHAKWSTPITFDLFNVNVAPNPDIPKFDVLTAFPFRGITHLFTGAGRLITSPGSTTTNTFTTGVNQAFQVFDLGRALVMVFPSGETFSATITGFTSIVTFEGVTFTDNLPAEFQGQTPVTATVITRDPTAFAIDRAEDGTVANNQVDASAIYQWNHLDAELLGKTVRMANVALSDPPPSNFLNPTPVTLLFGSDGVTTAMAGGVFFPVTFQTGEFISNPVDINLGIGRMIRTQVSLSQARRSLLHGVRLHYTTTNIPGRF